MTEKQSKILQAAIDIFCGKRLCRLLYSEIAQRAGVAEGTIFRHYKTKKDLLAVGLSPLLSPSWHRPSSLLRRNFNKVLDTQYDSYDLAHYAR